MHFSKQFENIKYDEAMNIHTSFKVGGKVDIYFEPKNPEELIGFINYLEIKGIPYFILGNGTNLLVSDSGIRGAIIKIGEKMSSIEVEGQTIIAQSGALLPALSKKALSHSLKYLEFASGIPGSVGGAITMNAGAYGYEIKDILTKVEVLDFNLKPRTIKNEDMQFGYRKSIISQKRYLVLKAYFDLEKGDNKKIKAKIDDLTERRQSKQPIDRPSAGSTFKRPEGNYAAKLIEDAGLKGFSIGGAQISDKHSGFIINKGNATAKDIYNLIKHTQLVVKDRFDIELETEIKLLGDFK